MEPFGRHLADYVCHSGARWISNGRSAMCFSMYLAQQQKLETSFIFKQLYRLNWRMQNNEEHRQNEGPIHLAFLRVLALSGLQRGENNTKTLVPILSSILAPTGF